MKASRIIVLALSFMGLLSLASLARADYDCEGVNFKGMHFNWCQSRYHYGPWGPVYPYNPAPYYPGPYYPGPSYGPSYPYWDRYYYRDHWYYRRCWTQYTSWGPVKRCGVY